MNFKSVISSAIIRGAAALLMAAGAISCNTIYDDQSDCPRGISLRFVYDYNMEFANSFHKQAHCLNVYVFDKDGHYLDNWVETSDVLKDENWRMQRKLDEGSYTLIAYAGLCCGETSFTAPQLQTRAVSRREEVSVSSSRQITFQTLPYIPFSTAWLLLRSGKTTMWRRPFT